jgi:hypothetical protein
LSGFSAFFLNKLIDVVQKKVYLVTTIYRLHMRKYYFKDAEGQQHGPLKLDGLKGKNITPNTPVWYDPLPKWTTAAEVDELKNIVVYMARVVEEKTTPVVEITEDVKPLITVVETPVAAIKEEEQLINDEPSSPVEQKPAEEKAVAIAPVVVMPVTERPAMTVSVTSMASVAATPSISFAATSANPVVPPPPVVTKPTQYPRKKSTAWLSWVLSLLVLGAAGYYVYQDIEKNKTDHSSFNGTEIKTGGSAEALNAKASTENNLPETVADTTSKLPTTTERSVTTTRLIAEKDKKTLAKKKAEDEKKKQTAAKAALEQQKADDEKKQEMAAQAVLAKELQFRNNWSKYITIGTLNYSPKGNDGINSFDIPVTNNTDVTIDKITIRVDYYKKEGKEKVMQTETLTIFNVPSKSGAIGKAPENKRARKAVATITAVTSKKLHLCYPQNNGNSADPYYCN